MGGFRCPEISTARLLHLRRVDRPTHMIKYHASQSGFSKVQFLVAAPFCLCAIFLGALSFAAGPRELSQSSAKGRSVDRIRGELINSTSVSGPGWSIVTPASNITYPYGLACTSNINCWAVGDGNPPAVAHWNGSGWTNVPSADLGGSQAALAAVACVGDSDCWAVGNIISANRQTLIEHWDGTSWSVVPSPSVAFQDNILAGVACTSNSDCWAVGYYSAHETLIEHWDGTDWTIVPSANVSGAGHNLLYGVTCTSPSNCWAVGDYSSTWAQTLIEHWDGVSWSIVPSPNSSVTQNNFFLGLACTSSTNCFAVGFYMNGNIYQTLVEQWNGIAWSISASPNSSSILNNAFYGVSCSSASDCWAVGFHDTGSPSTEYQELAEHWDGISWSIVSSPGVVASYLSSVVCLSSSQCWAVGSHNVNVSGPSKPLIEEYSPTIPPLTRVVSHMTHGNAGAFDVDLPLTGKRGVECRSGGANGNYSVVFSFVNDVANCGSTGLPGATITAGPNSNQCTENLTGVANSQYINVELDNIVDSQNNAGNVAVPMGVLIGDTNADGFVDAIDVSQTKSQSGSAASNFNFREDINLDGFVDAIDTSFLKSKSGTSLPSSP